MAALMKAVIDREADSVVTTTYNQKTISLAKARARKERPPGFKEESEAEVRDAGKPIELDAGKDAAVSINGNGSFNDNASSISNYQGLGIEGLPIDAHGGAEREPTPPASAKITTSVYSTMPGSVASGDADDDNDHDTALSVNEREAVAMSLPPELR
jgi:hypothetical protein